MTRADKIYSSFDDDAWLMTMLSDDDDDDDVDDYNYNFLLGLVFYKF